MRSKGTARELEQRRLLAVQRVEEGHAQNQVAAVLGVSARTVNRWVQRHREGGAPALAPKPTRGRPPKLSARQEKAVLSWVGKSPTAFGYADELWTSRRLAAQIDQRFGVGFNSNYLVEWLTKRGYCAQKPAKKAKEQDEQEVARWLAQEWPRIKKKPATSRPTSS